VLQTEELPSQVDDLDGDGKANELAFSESCFRTSPGIVTISFGEEDRKLATAARTTSSEQRSLQRNSRSRLESEALAFRIYFDPRNAIDIMVSAGDVASSPCMHRPEYVTRRIAEGRDYLSSRRSIGNWSWWRDGERQLVKSGDVHDREWRIWRADRCARSWNWNTTGGIRREDHSPEIANHQWQGKWIEHAISADSARTSLLLRADRATWRYAANSAKDRERRGSRLGKQVVAPGPTATEMVQDRILD